MKMDWEQAENYLYLMKGLYESIGSAGMFGLMFMEPIINRFENGERSEELYNEIMSIE